MGGSTKRRDPRGHRQRLPSRNDPGLRLHGSDDGDIISAGGVTSGLDLGLYLVERFASPQLAERIASDMEYERRGPVHVTASPASSVQA